MKSYRARLRTDQPRGSGSVGSVVSWDLVVPFAALWLTSLARVVRVIALGRAFGAIDTLAMVALVALPLLAWNGHASRR